MGKWTSEDWERIILVSTIPIGILIIPVNRLLGGAAISENATDIIKTLLTIIGAGLISRRKNSKDEG